MFTSGVLIHIPTEDILKVVGEMVRCSKRWIWGFEYWNENRIEVEYRGQMGLMWKDNFTKYFENGEKECKLIRNRWYKFHNDPNKLSEMYLLEKC